MFSFMYTVPFCVIKKLEYVLAYMQSKFKCHYIKKKPKCVSLQSSASRLLLELCLKEKYVYPEARPKTLSCELRA